MIKNTNEKKNRIHNFTVLFYNKLAEINEETFPLGMITTEFLNITKEQVDKFTNLLIDAYKVLDRVYMKSSFIHLSPYSKGNFKDFEVAFKKLLDVVNTLPLYKQLEIDSSDWIDRLRNVFHTYPKEDGYEELCKSLQSIQIIRDEIVVYQKYLLMFVDEFLEKAKLRNSHYYALALYDFLSNEQVQAELQKDKDSGTIVQFMLEHTASSEFVAWPDLNDTEKYAIGERKVFKSLAGFIIYDLLKALSAGNSPRKCHNCGIHFLLTAGYPDVYCDNPIEGDPKGRTCKDLGPHNPKKYKKNAVTQAVQTLKDRLKKQLGDGRIELDEHDNFLAYGKSLAKQFEDGDMPEHEIAEAISNISNSRRRKIIDEIQE